MKIYDYSLVRAVPDQRRGEWVNIGVCVYKHGELDIRLADSMAKLKAIDPNIDARVYRDISVHWNAIVDGIHSNIDRQIILKNLPLIHASSISQFVSEEINYEKNISAILSDLVVPPIAIRKKRDTQLSAILKNHLKKAKLFSEDPEGITEHKVISNFPVNKEANLYADFAAKNSVMHITETIDFRVGQNQLRGRHGLAAIKSITLDAANEKFPNCKRNVVYAFNERDADAVQPSLNLLRSYSMQMFNAADKNELASFIELTAMALR